MSKALVMQRSSKIDQENLLNLVERWREKDPSTKFFYRPYTLKPDSEKSAVPESDDTTSVNDDDNDVDYEEDDIKIAPSEKEEKSLLFVV